MVDNSPLSKQKPTDQELENRFLYDAPTPGKVLKHGRVSELMCATAKEIRDLVPAGIDLDSALGHLASARLDAHAGIACNPEE